ncbi:MAG: PH domain-containing protein [Lachnospiraceae bacterium]|nr:PH domain-containing protein [Lachnospiraceae bacterium]
MSLCWRDYNHQSFSSEVYLINNGRLTITRGYLTRETIALPLHEITNCRMSQTFVQRLRGLCTIYLTRENEQVIILADVETKGDMQLYQDMLDEIGRTRTANALMQQTRRHLFWGQDVG